MALLRRAVQGNVPTDGLLEILLLKTVAFLDVILAPVLFVSILLVLTRWSRDKEFTIFSASGIGPLNYLSVVGLIVLGAVCIVMPLSLYFTPQAERNFSRLLQEFKHNSVYTTLEQGEFLTSDGGKRVVFFSTGNNLPDEYRLFHYESHSPALESIAIARTGEIGHHLTTDDQSLLLNNGLQYWLSDGAPTYERIQFETFVSNLNAPVQFKFKLPIKAKPTLELIGSDNQSERAELMWRVSKVVMIPIVIAAAFAMGCVPLGNGVGVNLLTSVAIFFIYNSLISFSVDEIRQGTDYAQLMLWSIHGLALSLVVSVIIRYLDNKPALPGLLRTKL